MKKVFTILTLLLITAITASAAIVPVKFTVATTPNTSPGAQLTIDLLNSNGTALGSPVSINKGATVATDEDGVLTFILNEAAWTGATYNKDYLVRVTYGGVVLSIERLEVVCQKQGLFGEIIDPSEIDAEGTTGYFLKNVNGVTTWVAPQALEGFSTAYVDVTGKNLQIIDLSAYGNYNVVVLTGNPGGTEKKVYVDPGSATLWPTGVGVKTGHMLMVANRMDDGTGNASPTLLQLSTNYITPEVAARRAAYRMAHLFVYGGSSYGWVYIGGNH